MQNSESSLSGAPESADSTPPKPKAGYSMIDTHDLPSALKDLYPIAEVNGSNDAFVILLHAFMLEVGFIPKNVPQSENLKLLPTNCQQNEKGLHTIEYCHYTCPEVCCSMICFPLYQQLSVFGTITGVHTSQEPPNTCFQLSCYVNSDSIGSSNPAKIFSNVKELSQSFKDKFAYPLLAVVQDALGFGPTFGLPAAMDEIKMQILSRLPVGGLVAMTRVNKEFSELCNFPLLWKKLCLKDFPDDFGDGKEANQDWKKLYKEKYLKQKQQRMRRCYPEWSALRWTENSTLFSKNQWHPPGMPPDFGPDFPFGIEDTRIPFPDPQPEARPHNLIHPPHPFRDGPEVRRRNVICPPFPHNPMLNIPHIFRL